LHHLYHDRVSELTALPGSEAVEAAITRRTAMPSERWSIIYVDIERFTVYNEVYSYLEGDEMIKLASKVLRDVVASVGNPGDFIGHMGGDNFVIITTPDRTERIQAMAQARFNAAVPDFYSPTDRNQGYVVSINHEGSLCQTPLASLSFDVVDNDPGTAQAEPLAEGAEPVH
jgi:diguanylate cyclase (GGDEF)-like protein